MSTRSSTSPAPGIDRALVIAGSDKRGTIFGMYDLSQRIGVSPWHWWADVPVARRARPVRPPRPPRREAGGEAIAASSSTTRIPALFGWAQREVRRLQRTFYEHVFELILRLRGNYLWPAMWGKRDLRRRSRESRAWPTSMGIVIGTSHHEPMMRAHVEWVRRGEGAVELHKQRRALREFWREGIERMGGNESLVTVGMRGDGDEPMTEGTAIELLERIVADQRTIIERSDRPARRRDARRCGRSTRKCRTITTTACGCRTTSRCSSPTTTGATSAACPSPATDRPGGYGVYYHFDYVGGPRNYKWLNTNQIARIWEQMHLAYEHGADRLWIVNVGDIKPMEFPTSSSSTTPGTRSSGRSSGSPIIPAIWAARQFGDTHAAAIGEIVTSYSQLAARRKPELLGPETYSLVHFDEADRVAREWGLLQSARRD